MQPYTAPHILRVLDIECGLDRYSASALVKSSLDASAKPRRSFRAVMQAIFTLVF